MNILQRFILIIFIFLAGIRGLFALDLTIDTPLVRGHALPICSTDIEQTGQYGGLPTTPLVHHYTNFSRPNVMLVIKGP